MNHGRNTNWRHQIYYPGRTELSTWTHTCILIFCRRQPVKCHKRENDHCQWRRSKIVGIAAREIDGVHDVVGSGAGATITGLATRVTRGDTRAQGVSVDVGEREAAASINMVVVYGVSIPNVAEAVRRNVIDRVEAMTGLTVIAVDIAVNDLYFPEEETEEERPRVQ